MEERCEECISEILYRAIDNFQNMSIILAQENNSETEMDMAHDRFESGMADLFMAAELILQQEELEEELE